MSTESTQLVLRQIINGDIPQDSIITKIMSELSPADVEHLRAKAADGMLNIELQRMAAAGRFQASSSDINEFIQNVRAIEVSSKGVFTNFNASGEFNTASGKTRIEVKKGCFIATEVYGSYEHKNVLVLRDFRDKYLESFGLGRILCGYYYRCAPKLLRLPYFNLLFRRPIKAILNTLCSLIQPKK